MVESGFSVVSEKGSSDPDFPRIPLRVSILRRYPGTYMSTLARTLAFGVLFTALSTQAAPWVYGELPMVATPLDSALQRTWEGLKARNIRPWSDGLVHRPKSETPGDAVSEGQAYGMMVALYVNDQAGFDAIWDAAEKNMWNDGNGFYDWRWQDGKVTANGMATDADQDIALMLIFADALVSKGIWKAHTSPKGVGYKARAQAILNTLWSKGVNAGALRPGANWGGGGTCSNGQGSWACGEHVNPGYFSPASYRIFKDFDKSHAWGDVVEKSYALIAKSPGYAKGMIPDWMNLDGSYPTASALGYNPFDGGKGFYKDAIRVHWRLAMDWAWFREPRAKTFLDAAYAFVGHNPTKANFYRMDGSLVPAESTFTLNGTKGPSRSRREHSPLTVGMWACAAMGSGGADSADAWAAEMLKYHAAGSDVWGLKTDPMGGVEDTAHNEVYFDQFLAWFGASILAGRFTNILADLADSEAGTAQAWTKRPFVSVPVADVGTGGVTVLANLARTGAWAVVVTHTESGIQAAQTGVGTMINASVSRNYAGIALPKGASEVRVRVRGLPDTVFTWVIGSGSGVTPRTPVEMPSLFARGGRLDASGLTGSVARLRTPDGRLLGERPVVSGSASFDVPRGGILFLETQSAHERSVRRVLLLP